MPQPRLDTRKEVQPVQRAPLVGRGFNMAEFNAVHKRLGVVQQISMQTAAEAEDYAAQNKHADMVADSLAYESEAQRLTNEANNAASLTSDPKEVERIYKAAQDSLEKWVGGKNAGGGPNIRWEDLVSDIKADAEKRRVHFAALKDRRQSEISIVDTKAKGEQAILDGVRSNNHALIRDGVGVMVLNGSLTAEQGELRVKQEVIRAENAAVRTVAREIEQLPLDQAEAAAKEFKKGLGSKFPSLNREEVAAARQSIDRAVQISAEHLARVKKAEQAAALKDSVRLLDFMSNPSPAWTPEVAESFGLHRKEYLEMSRNLAKGNDTVERGADFYDFLAKANAYNPNTDPDGSSLRGLVKESLSFGKDRQFALSELAEVVGGTQRKNKISTAAWKEARRRLIELVTAKNSVDLKRGWGKKFPLGGSLEYSDTTEAGKVTGQGEVYRLYSQVESFLRKMAEDANLTENQMFHALEDHDAFKTLTDTTNLAAWAEDFYRMNDSGIRSGALSPVADEITAEGFSFDGGWDAPAYGKALEAIKSVKGGAK